MRRDSFGSVLFVSLVGHLVRTHLNRTISNQPPHQYTHPDSIELDRPPSVYTAAKLMSTMIYRNKDNLMGACVSLRVTLPFSWFVFRGSGSTDPRAPP